MATLSIINNLSLPTQGTTITAKQGTYTDSDSTAFAITVSGQVNRIIDTLNTATVKTIYDDDNTFPIDWVYLHYWADQDSYIQIIGSGSNAIFKIAAKQPFVLPGFDSILAAANTTIITGGAEPAVTDIDSIVIGNYSGSTMNYVLTIVN